MERQSNASRAEPLFDLSQPMAVEPGKGIVISVFDEEWLNNDRPSK